jgi:hypothetical protein
MSFEQSFIRELYLIKQAGLISNAMNYGRKIISSPITKNVGNTAKNALSEGWNGVDGNKNRWFGAKGLMVAGGATQLPGALSEEDPTGQGRTRAERLTTFGAGQLGNLAGGSLIKHQFGKGLIGGAANMALPMASSIAAQNLSEKMVSIPFKPFRSVQNQQKNLASQQQDLTLT